MVVGVALDLESFEVQSGGVSGGWIRFQFTKPIEVLLRPINIAHGFKQQCQFPLVGCEARIGCGGLLQLH